MTRQFGNFAMYTDLLFYYDDYVEECKKEGKEPKSIKEWYDEQE